MCPLRYDVVPVSGGRTRARRLAAVMALCLLATGTASAGDEHVVTVTQSRGVYHVAATFTVTQAPAAVVAALTDYPEIPRFMPQVQTSTVLERADNRAVVEQEAVARFMMFSKRIHLVLEVEQQPGVIRFRDRSGRSFTSYTGTWTITGRDSGTEIGYTLHAAPAFDVPEFLLKRLLKRDAGQMIERLRVEIASAK